MRVERAAAVVAMAAVKARGGFMVVMGVKVVGSGWRNEGSGERVGWSKWIRKERVESGRARFFCRGRGCCGFRNRGGNRYGRV